MGLKFESYRLGCKHIPYHLLEEEEEESGRFTELGLFCQQLWGKDEGKVEKEIQPMKMQIKMWGLGDPRKKRQKNEIILRVSLDIVEI